MCIKKNHTHFMQHSLVWAKEICWCLPSLPFNTNVDFVTKCQITVIKSIFFVSKKSCEQEGTLVCHLPLLQESEHFNSLSIIYLPLLKTTEGFRTLNPGSSVPILKYEIHHVISSPQPLTILNCWSKIMLTKEKLLCYSRRWLRMQATGWLNV